MNQKAHIVILTGNEWRHRYVASELAKTIDLVGVVIEAKPSRRSAASQNSGQQADEIIRQHFAERDESEHRYFGQHVAYPRTDCLEIANGTVNAEAVFEWIEKRSPDVLVLYGTSLIKPPLLKHYQNRIINMHLGLSPYYRGAGTNFWPLVYREPECVGATIHLAVEKVDAGAILGQVRPDVDVSDGPHDMGNKTIMAGVRALAILIKKYLSGTAVPAPQDLEKGRIFRRKDFNAQSVVEMRAHFKSGMIAQYLEDMNRRRRHYPIMEVEVHA